jgi:tetratricopeptide (TPR) repeat protein
VYVYRGIVYTEGLKQYLNAVLDFNKAVELNPKNEKAYIFRGIAYFEMKEYSVAISDFSKAIEIYTSFALIYYYRGFAYRKYGDLFNYCKDREKVLELGDSGAEELLDEYCK